MQDSPQQLRKRAEYCRNLATSQADERTRLILNGMAHQYDDQAREITQQESLLGDK